ncbi:OmpA family protein [Mucilaginibacter ginkgonis]|uniref:OmpA family protein n=1 Tax=Mucilaginibacter ginkgonis TaxID=2682091 RepID=A0A6I4HWB0_9SPHI|nr:OmpA family protein [Mucilaginibacter ginkgonis]QQL51229.1 OmpA family protein [Mucilaginibacter ginkgonis]
MNNLSPKLIWILLLTCLSISAKGQFVLKLADEQFKLYNYYQAASLYEKAYRAKPLLSTVQKLAVTYHQMRDYKNEESWYAMAVEMSPSAENLLGYAKALQSNARYPEAKIAYNRYTGATPPGLSQNIALLTASCDSAIKWMRSPTNFLVTNQLMLNTSASEWGASVYESKVVFASDRMAIPNNKTSAAKPFLKFDGNQYPDNKIYEWTGSGYLKLYTAIATDSGSTPGLPFFKDKGTAYHTGPASFDADGRGMYYTIDERIPNKHKRNADRIETFKLNIYYAREDRSSGGWTTPIAFKYNQPGFSTGDPYVTPDGKRLYFSSDMPGGKGGTDLYYCTRLADNSWGVPVNITELNTTGNERTPMYDNRRNFYYATDGNITMGGLDIYSATLIDGKFSNIKNLAYPVNSPQDDFAYLSYNGKSGYLSSNRTGGMGSDDIYKFYEKPPLVLRLEGIAYDKTSKQPLDGASVSLTCNTFLINYQTDGTGHYAFTLLADKDYYLKGDKRTFISDQAQLTTNGLKVSQTLVQDLYLEKIKINAPIILANINYDFNKANIRADARPALDHLIEVMHNNPTIWIELGSHTDSRGSDKYNLALSYQRARSAVDYIVTTGGIDPARIVAKGYGETKLLNTCGNNVACSEAEHQINRRTEFKITRQ